MKNLTINRVKEMMENKISKGMDDNEFIFDNILSFKKIKGKSVINSFFEIYPDIAENYLNKLFDELHPF